MTRLRSDDICNITANLNKYNQDLVGKTGCTLGQIAAHAVQAGEGEICRDGVKVAVIPMTCGQGVINGFAESVAGIVRFLGFKALVTECPDAGGVAEAVQGGAKVVMMADDHRFVAVNLNTHKVADNGEATGKGYAAALNLMSGGVTNKNVLVIGAGPVGKNAALALTRLGALVSIYDIDEMASGRLVSEVFLKCGSSVQLENDLDSALMRHQLILDACPAGAFIKIRHLKDQKFIAAPGIPLGIANEGLAGVSHSLIHDPLEIGVATMIYDVLKCQ